MEVCLILVGVVASGLLAYAWLGYYPLLRLLTRRRLKKSISQEVPAEGDEALPELVVIIAAYNEAEVIAGRVENLRQIEYPPDRFFVYIGCDGCSDNTAKIARQACAEDACFVVEDYDRNRGKATVLKELVARARQAHPSALLVFSDANTHFAPDALRRLVRHFGNPEIGGVCGRLVFTAGGRENPAQEGAYWRMETRLKVMESALDSCLGANGAIYVIRPELFPDDLPDNTIVDDFVIGMKVREKGARMIFDAEALAFEELPATVDEWQRRVRIGAGDFQAMVICKDCLLPQYGIFAFCLFSHKILRWFTSHLMLSLLAAGGALAVMAATGATVLPAAYIVMAGAFAVLSLILLGTTGRIVQRAEMRSSLARLTAVCDHFVTMHAALFVGFLRFCSGNMSGAWRRTPR